MSKVAVKVLVRQPIREITSAAVGAMVILVWIVNAAWSQERPSSFADLVDRLSPAVVNITTTTVVAQVSGPRPIVPEGSPLEDFFRDFLDRQQGPQRERRSNALGSGFVISADGFIVTNNHVIDAADEISIEFFDGTELPAEVVGTDPRTDIALLRVKSLKPLTYVEFGDSDVARVGDWVLAIGNPLGQGFSVSAGIISARNRSLQGAYDDFIQTDAAINRGNSGGPLFNMDGEVIGVNTAILSPNGGSIGLGFSMSSAVVERVIEQLKDFGETRRGWLGVSIQDVTPDVAEALGLSTTEGALITDVPDGPAADGGIRSGDVIIGFDGRDVADTRALVRMVGETEVGKSVDVTVLREGEKLTLAVALGRRESAEQALIDGSGQNKPVDVQGMTLSTLTDALREEHKIAEDIRGVVLVAVAEDSEAFEKGLRTGDVITEVSQLPVATPADVASRLKEAKDAGRKSVLLLVRRDGQPRFVALVPAGL